MGWYQGIIRASNGNESTRSILAVRQARRIDDGVAKTDWCRWCKNERLCTEMCRYKDCENTDIEFDKPDYEADIDLDD